MLKIGVARQLLEIARIESDIPLKEEKVLIAGEGKTAVELTRLLREMGIAVFDLNKAAGEKDFSLVFLTEPADDDKLLPLIAKNATVIDCAVKSNGNWAVFDGKNSFRRVRVVSLEKTDG